MSGMEATQYYAGLPSSPCTLARTGTDPWEKPTGAEAYRKLKQLGVVVNHELNATWENKVAPKVLAYLDDMGVKWTSTDIVRISEVGDSFAPVILWIGVKPKSLVSEVAHTAAFGCLKILNEFDITDVDVEIRESSVTRSAGPKLLSPALSSNPIVEVHHPFTYALGLPISAQATPSIGGTGGFFMVKGDNSDKLLLITTRHVVLPPRERPNDKYECKDDSQPRFNVLVPGDKAYESCLASIMTRIKERGMMVEHGQLRVRAVEGRDDEEAVAEHKAAQNEIEEAERAIKALYTFYADVKDNWATIANRVLGHVVYSPPIRLGAGTADEQYTEDYAIIEVDNDKVDRIQFKGNVIDLGTKMPIWEFTEKMHPKSERATSLEYPTDRLLKLSGIVSDNELRHPTALDRNGKPCLKVIKNGSTTGMTIGRASGIMSFVREYFDDGSHQMSKELPILPYDTESGPFSAPGDSGAVIVDGRGRLVALLTGGAGSTASFDISYATPIGFLLKSIKANGYPNAHLA